MGRSESPRSPSTRMCSLTIECVLSQHGKKRKSEVSFNCGGGAGNTGKPGKLSKLDKSAQRHNELSLADTPCRYVDRERERERVCVCVSIFGIRWVRGVGMCVCV